jgi:hypothetical protein
VVAGIADLVHGVVRAAVGIELPDTTAGLLDLDGEAQRGNAEHRRLEAAREGDDDAVDTISRRALADLLLQRPTGREREWLERRDRQEAASDLRDRVCACCERTLGGATVKRPADRLNQLADGDHPVAVGITRRTGREIRGAERDVDATDELVDLDRVAGITVART